MGSYNSFDVDLHLHGKYSGGTSYKMEIPVIAEQAIYKGLDLVGTSDCIHGGWLEHLKKSLEEVGPGTYKHKDHKTKFILQTEIEAYHRIHHVVFLPDFEAAKDLRNDLKKYGNLDTDGRPKLKLSGEELAGKVLSVGGMIGPAHAFTPYTAVYSVYGSLKECYGKHIDDIHFLELGLSANTDLASEISELDNLTFLSNSDCHSPWPDKLGREFNRLEIKDATYSEVMKAIKGEDKRKFALNVGVPCIYGKYHLTRCRKCLTFYHLKDAQNFNWKCQKCKGMIKKGVKEKIEELSGNGKRANHPPYLSITPLAEIISLARGVSTVHSDKVQNLWKEFIKLGTEIEVLIDLPIEKLREVDQDIAGMINRFRKNQLHYIPGGGGEYGKLVLEKPKQIDFYDSKQKKLEDWG